MSRGARRVVLILLAAAAVAVAAAVYLRGRTFVVRLSQDDLRAELDERLPFTRTYVSLLQFTLENPSITLAAGSDRIRTGFDVALLLLPGGTVRDVRGSVEVSAALRYEPDNGQFFLVEPVIENLEVPRLPERYATRVRDGLSALMAEYYAMRPVYTLRPGDVRHATTKLLLRDVRVEDGVLLLTLGI